MSDVVLSQGWETRPLIEVATLQRGYDLPTQDRTDGPYPIFAANGPVGTHAIAKCKGPGVVTGRSGTIGKVHFVDGDYWPLNTSLYVTDFHGNDPRWVFYLLQSFGLERFSQGAGVPTLNRNLVHGEPISVPPLPEQRRIAAILDQAEALRAKRREALAQLDSLTQSIFIEMFGDPATNPKGWPRKPIQTLCGTSDDIKCGPFGTQLAKSEVTEEGVPLWGIKNVNAAFRLPAFEYLHSTTANRLKAYGITAGDIVMTRKGTIGNCAVYPKDFPDGVMHSDLLRIRTDAKRCLPVFLSHQLHHSKDVERQLALISGGAVMPGINVTKLKTIEVLVPEIEQQQEFLKRSSAVDELRTNLVRATHDLNCLFSSLQHRAFQGAL